MTFLTSLLIIIITVSSSSHHNSYDYLSGCQGLSGNLQYVDRYIHGEENLPKHESTYTNVYKIDLRSFNDDSSSRIGIRKTPVEFLPIRAYDIADSNKNWKNKHYEVPDSSSSTDIAEIDNKNLQGILYYTINNVKVHENKKSIMIDQNLQGILYYTINNVKVHENKKSIMIDQKTEENANYSSTYKSKYLNSRIYKFKVRKTAKIYVLLLSEKEYYFPQLTVSESKGNHFSTIESVGRGKSGSLIYKVKKSTNIIFDIGYDSKLDSYPFRNDNKKDAFVMVISAVRSEIVNVYESKKIEAGRHTGTTTFEHGKPLYLMAGYKKNENLDHGQLNLNLTPLIKRYKNSKESIYSITWYYTKGSKLQGLREGRSSIVNVNCHTITDHNRWNSNSIEFPIGNYKFYYSSKKVCNLGKFLDSFVNEK